MKLEVGVAKGRDLSFRREDNLRILNGVLDIVLFEDCAHENTTKEAQAPEVGDPEQIVHRPRSIGYAASLLLPSIMRMPSIRHRPAGGSNHPATFSLSAE